MILVNLAGIDHAGIGVGGKDLSDWIKKKYSLPDAPNDVAMFIPLAQINFLIIGVQISCGPKVLGFPARENGST